MSDWPQFGHFTVSANSIDPGLHYKSFLTLVYITVLPRLASPVFHKLMVVIRDGFFPGPVYVSGKIGAAYIFMYIHTHTHAHTHAHTHTRTHTGRINPSSLAHCINIKI